MIIASNRGPYTFAAGGFQHSSGGLVSAVEPVLSEAGGTWIAWAGRTPAESNKNAQFDAFLPYNFSEVTLTAEEHAGYYLGFANRVLWPLCHGFVGYCHFAPEYWKTYVKVNRKFARQVARAAPAGDLVWLNDYHLALAPLFLATRPDLKLFFFWHIPFPAWETWRILPWGRQILRGLAACRRVGFHTQEYAENFKNALRHEGLAEPEIVATPIGIDAQHFRDLAAQEKTKRFAAAWRSRLNTKRVLIGVDRQDYTKGLPEKLRGFEKFLSDSPRWAGKVSLVQVMVPSRTDIPEYRAVRTQVEQDVRRINQKFGRTNYRPVELIYRSLSPPELVGLYLAADAALVTPLRDGLNLVAKEYIASHWPDDGVLVLSRWAGAAQGLSGAILTNPYHSANLARAISTALTMPAKEKSVRFSSLKKLVFHNNLFEWRDTFLAGQIDEVTSQGTKTAT